MKRIVVIGGGITGLAAAYRLQKLAQEAAQAIDIVLVDSEPQLGGKIVTERVDDFVIEGGPDTFISYKPWGVALCRELGLVERLHGTSTQQHGSFVMNDGELHRLPEGLTGMIPTRFGPMVKTPLISLWGKLRMGLDFVLPPRREDGDESLASFISRRLGREMYARLVEPLMSGIYAGDGGQLSLASTFPQLRKLELEHGGLVKGLLAARKNSARRKPSNGKKMSVFVTPRTGLAELVEVLVERLTNVSLVTGKRVQTMTATAGGYQLVTQDGRQPSLATTFDSIPYVSTATLSVAYPLSDVPHPLNGYGYIIPRVEARDALACTWTSSKFPHRAPEGYALLRVFIGRAGQEAALDGSDEELLQIVRTELERTLGITAEPMFHRLFRWPDSMPQYTMGHPDRLAKIDDGLQQHPGLFIAGSAYRGIGIPDCINSGQQAAQNALDVVLSK